MIRLGLDPGLQTGWSVWQSTATRPATMLDSGVIKGGTKGFIDWWPTFRAAYDLTDVVCEKFIMDGTITVTDPCQIEGALLALSDVPITWQPRGDKAALLPTEPARRGWFKAAGIVFNSSHALDAATHVIVKYKREKHLATLRQFWPQK